MYWDCPKLQNYWLDVQNWIHTPNFTQCNNVQLLGHNTEPLVCSRSLFCWLPWVCGLWAAQDRVPVYECIWTESVEVTVNFLLMFEGILGTFVTLLLMTELFQICFTFVSSDTIRLTRLVQSLPSLLSESMCSLTINWAVNFLTLTVALQVTQLWFSILVPSFRLSQSSDLWPPSYSRWCLDDHLLSNEAGLPQWCESEILQQPAIPYSQVSELCHDKPVNRVAQWVDGWRTGTPLFWSACNCNFLQLMLVGRAEIVLILKCILHLDHTYHNVHSILKVSAI